jgi:hypothetical protein
LLAGQSRVPEPPAIMIQSSNIMLSINYVLLFRKEYLKTSSS